MHIATRVAHSQSNYPIFVNKFHVFTERNIHFNKIDDGKKQFFFYCNKSSQTTVHSDDNDDDR